MEKILFYIWSWLKAWLKDLGYLFQLWYANPGKCLFCYRYDVMTAVDQLEVGSVLGYEAS